MQQQVRHAHLDLVLSKEAARAGMLAVAPAQVGCVRGDEGGLLKGLPQPFRGFNGAVGGWRHESPRIEAFRVWVKPGVVADRVRGDADNRSGRYLDPIVQRDATLDHTAEGHC